MVHGPTVTVVEVLMLLNNLFTYVLIMNPLSQSLEEAVNLPTRFGWRRCLLRTSLVVVGVLVGLAVKNFGRILNLIGSFSVPFLTFVLPPIFYIRLCDSKENGNWPKRRAHQYASAPRPCASIHAPKGAHKSMACVKSPQVAAPACAVRGVTRKHGTSTSWFIIVNACRLRLHLNLYSHPHPQQRNHRGERVPSRCLSAEPITDFNEHANLTPLHRAMLCLLVVVGSSCSLVATWTSLEALLAPSDSALNCFEV
ncbi:hypothetical protein E2C01_038395 [Portunus trituberculatus]|uniref:Amino acid transporter transmembrane domain-containing protein n=1 Tax=Portunus trituberculatus TaxID=210409 RepID=A0A5B7FH49_PORTR|nr:hypothetical protein [Portunus trituberculatus]